MDTTTPSTSTFLDGMVRITGDFVSVELRTQVDLLFFESILAAIDDVLQASGLVLVLIDSRKLEQPDEEVNELFRAWVDACMFHDRVALLIESELGRIACNMRALAKQSRVRAFHQREEAVAWLNLGALPVRQAV